MGNKVFWTRVAVIATVILATVASFGMLIYYGGGHGSLSESTSEEGSGPVSAHVIPDVSACDEIDFSRYSRGTVGPNELVQTTKPRAIVYINGDVERGARISLIGEGSCLYVNGSIAADVAILVEGDESGIVVNGSIAQSASIQMSGHDSVMSLTSFEFGPDSPLIRVNGPGGGKLFVKDGHPVYA